MSLTIGVCAFNEEKNIGSILTDVLNQSDLPQDLAIIVVASGCTDNTPAVVRQMMRHDDRVQLIEEQTRTGKTGAINLILSRCRTELLALVDADVRLRQYCFAEILRCFSDQTVGVVGALPIVGNAESGEIAKSAAAISRVLRHAATDLASLGQLSYVMGEMYCFRTGIVQRLPSEIVNDDAYVATCARLKDYRVDLAPRAEFVTKVPSTVWDYVAQRRRITFGHMQIKTRMGRFATSIEGMALGHPWVLLRAMVREAASDLLNVARSVVILELEITSTLMAWLDRVRRKEHVIY